MYPAKSKPIPVRSTAGDYFIHCRRNLLRRTAQEIARLGKFSSIHILTSPRVWRALEKKIRTGLPPKTNVHLFNDAESAKSLNTVETLARKLVRAGADRKSLLIAIGGGVVG